MRRKIAKFSGDGDSSQISTVFKTNQSCSPRPRFPQMKVCAKITSYSLFEHPGFCLIFILSKKKHFQSGALLKMPPSSPTIEEFGLDIQK